MNSKLRQQVVPATAAADDGQHQSKAYAMSWAQRLKRVFAIEIDKCEKCGGKLRVIASIEDPEVISKILTHLGLDAASQDHNRSPPVGLLANAATLF